MNSLCVSCCNLAFRHSGMYRCFKHGDKDCCGAAQYRYFVFLFLITAQAVITCQYDPFAPPGYHGEVRLRHFGLRVTAGVGVNTSAKGWGQD